MPYLLVRIGGGVLQNGPTQLGDKAWTDVELMQRLDAKKQYEGSAQCCFVTKLPPRVVLDRLEQLGWHLKSQAADGGWFSWTLHKP